ncbi:helix-turn-helix domain-containing protein [Larkinella humicola]|uniref:Helix-turn-helix transcriptional regulator n=1 Tax=Larkinella humicola TaxID=2607654 RepID=A0A5N1JN42_9BACT|nr:AraC family transcriptional regulator [Larkinella humicola]KAA9357571.1 helix-turn-helix transcriptional regulator [Larkinella humicola]
MKLYIKHMVCGRCKRVVRDILEELGIEVLRVELGEVETNELPATVSMEQIRQVLADNDFELLEDRKTVVVEQIKTLIVNEVHHDRRERPEHQNLSDFLTQKIGYDYSYLSHLFSAIEGMTIEKYVIAQKIEKVKEYLLYGELTLSEIAWRLGYSSTQHLSNQFKQVVGLTPGDFKRTGLAYRTEIDKVGPPK